MVQELQAGRPQEMGAVQELQADRPLEVGVVQELQADRPLEVGVVQELQADRPLEVGVVQELQADRPLEVGVVQELQADRPLEVGVVRGLQALSSRQRREKWTVREKQTESRQRSSFLKLLLRHLRLRDRQRQHLEINQQQHHQRSSTFPKLFQRMPHFQTRSHSRTQATALRNWFYLFEVAGARLIVICSIRRTSL